MPTSARPWLLATLVAVTLGALPHDQLQCEQAISHLHDCCTLHEANVCGGGCNPVTLSLEESDCIREMDCDEIEAADICGRIERLSLSAQATTDAGAPHEAVCP